MMMGHVNWHEISPDTQHQRITLCQEEGAQIAEGNKSISIGSWAQGAEASPRTPSLPVPAMGCFSIPLSD